MTMEYVKDNQLGFGGGGWEGWKKGIIIFLAVILGAFIISWLNSPLIVTVTGSSEVSVPATSATVSLTVSAGDSSPQGAIDQVKTKANNLRQVLRSTWVDEKDIIESQITVVPAAAYIAGATGYQASLTIGAKTSNLEGMDALISQLYSNGATVVAQPVLSADKQSELEAQAMNEAMNDAKQQANDLAKKNFKFLKKIVSVAQASSASTATATTKTEISGSEFKIAKAVQVSYKMW